MASGDCSTKRILKQRYQADFRVYLEATRSMEEATGSPAFHDEYERVKRSQRVFEHSKSELHRHCAEHGCGDLDA